MSRANDQFVEARHRILVAAGAALLAAGLILVMFVLPAEYAIDPLGTGARVGLLDLGVVGQQVEALSNAAPAAAAGDTPIVVPQDRAFKQETVEFKVAPREGMEYKYRLEKGESLLFSWSATAPVNYELHAEPDGAPRGYAQSYEVGQQRTGASGTLNAPFSGIHGWFWENTTGEPVTVTLTASGYTTYRQERDGRLGTTDRAAKKLDIDPADYDAGDHESYMHKEMLEQPEAVERTIRGVATGKDEVLERAIEVVRG